MGRGWAGLPCLTSLTALTNIYLVWSLGVVVPVWGYSRPPPRPAPRTAGAAGTRYSLDSWETEEQFRPSVRWEGGPGRGRVRTRRPTSPYSSYRQPGLRRQSARPARPHSPDFELAYDYDYDYSPAPRPPAKPGLLQSVLSALQPAPAPPPPRPTTQSEPSLEWLYNDIDDDDDFGKVGGSVASTETFIPNNADYDDGNIDYRDEVWDFRDVIHSIKNNESRILTLKKFLSAASGLSDRAGTDPAFMLWNMPVTILSILGIFYAISAVAVLGYKYTLLTAGNSNGQAVALLPVALLFAVPLIASLVFVVGRNTVDGRISLSRLARGDRNWLRPDFDSVDFLYDAGNQSSHIAGSTLLVMEGGSTALGCVPLRPAAWSVSLLQLVYGSVRVYLATQTRTEQRTFSFYLHFSGHCVSIAAALVLIVGLLFEKRNLLLPWVGLTLLTPVSFLATLAFNLILLNLPAAWWLIMKEGVPVVLISYALTLVYSLYLELGATQAASSEGSRSQYGGSGVVWLTESSSSVAGGDTRDQPPSYDSLVQVHKQHTQASASFD